MARTPLLVHRTTSTFYSQAESFGRSAPSVEWYSEPATELVLDWAATPSNLTNFENGAPPAVVLKAMPAEVLRSHLQYGPRLVRCDFPCGQVELSHEACVLTSETRRLGDEPCLQSFSTAMDLMKNVFQNKPNVISEAESRRSVTTELDIIYEALASSAAFKDLLPSTGAQPSVWTKWHLHQAGKRDALLDIAVAYPARRGDNGQKGTPRDLLSVLEIKADDVMSQAIFDMGTWLHAREVEGHVRVDGSNLAVDVVETTPLSEVDSAYLEAHRPAATQFFRLAAEAAALAELSELAVVILCTETNSILVGSGRSGRYEGSKTHYYSPTLSGAANTLLTPSRLALALAFMVLESQMTLPPEERKPFLCAGDQPASSAPMESTTATHISSRREGLDVVAQKARPL